LLDRNDNKNEKFDSNVNPIFSNSEGIVLETNTNANFKANPPHEVIQKTISDSTTHNNDDHKNHPISTSSIKSHTGVRNLENQIVLD